MSEVLGDWGPIPPILGGPLFAVLFYWLALALGSRLLRLLRAPLTDLTVWERGVVATALGTGTLQYLPFLLGQFGRLTPSFVRGSLAVLIVVLAFDLWRVARAVVRAVRGLTFSRPSRTEAIWAGLLVTMLVTLLIRCVTFGETGDDDGIHLATPKRWLQAGSLIYLPSLSLTNATLGFDMIYLIALAVWNPIGAKALHFGAGLFLLLGLYLAGRRLSSGLTGRIAISLLMITTPFFDLAYAFSSAMIDLAACWMMASSLLLWLVWREKQKTHLLVCMALCGGLAISFKLTAVQVAFGWTVILLVDARRAALPWARVAAVIVIFGALSMVPVLPWFYRNWSLTGNPLYPMFSHLIPTRDWTPELAGIFGRYMKYYSWGVAAGSRLDESARKGLILLTLVLVTLGGLVAYWRVRKPVLRSLIIFATVYVVSSVGLTGLIFRYWLPASLGLALVFGTLVAERWRGRTWPLWLPPALLVVALLVSARKGYPPHSGVTFMADVRLATGTSSYRQEYGHRPLMQTWSFLNSQTPVNSRILLAAFYRMIGASSYAGFWVEDRMCYTTDPHLQSHLRLDDWASFLASVRAAGIQYLVLSDQLFTPGRLGFTFPAVDNELPFTRRLAQEYGEQVFQADFMRVYRLRPVP